jgi:hypothetical protein
MFGGNQSLNNICNMMVLVIEGGQLKITTIED